MIPPPESQRDDCERFPFADAPGFSYNRRPGGGFYAFKA